MARVSLVETFIEGGISDAIEWITGDTDEVRAWLAGNNGKVTHVSLDGLPDVASIDLTNGAVEVQAEFATGSVVVKGSLITVGDLKIDDTLPSVALASRIVEAADGEIGITIPAGLYGGPLPKPAIVTGVPIVIVYATATFGLSARTARFLLILRRGVAP